MDCALVSFMEKLGVVKSASIMLVLLALLVFVCEFSAGVYFMYGLEPLPTVQFLYHGAFLCGLIWWLQADAGMSVVKRVYCPGLLVSSGWLIIVPYHLIKTRGVKGLLPFLVLIGSYVVAYILTLLLYVLLVAFNPP